MELVMKTENGVTKGGAATKQLISFFAFYDYIKVENRKTFLSEKEKEKKQSNAAFFNDLTHD